jgi:ferritin-like metal-binding protein YciE
LGRAHQLSPFFIDIDEECESQSASGSGTQPFISIHHRTTTLRLEKKCLFAPAATNATLAYRKESFMKLFSANIKDLRTLYISNLKKTLDMEQKITKALPDLIQNSSDPELVQAFRNHLEETNGHVSKIRSLLQQHEGNDSTETCKVIDGLTTEASDTIKDVTDRSVRDIALIGAAQQVEHHEIAVYGTLRRWAEIIGLSSDASILESIEAEEIKADELLTQIAGAVNMQAAA